MVAREDGRGLHDLLFNTKVISIENEEIEPKDIKTTKKIIEAEYKEEDEKWKEKQTKKNKKK